MQANGYSRARTDPWFVRWTLIGSTYAIIGLLVLVPIIKVFGEAFRDGIVAYWTNLTGDPETRHSIFLTLMVAPVAVALNTVFGVAAAWCVARFRFPGRTILITLIDLPFSVSPVVAGLMFVLLFGMRTPVGSWLLDHGYQVIFAPPGLVLATAFVTFPFVARELIPIMEAVGTEEEVAARCLGANGWSMFWRVTMPNIKWGLLYGMILCNARAMGEYGAIYVVSGRIGGVTSTMPIHVQKLFESGGKDAAAYALASLLTLLAIATLFIKVMIERKIRQDQIAAAKPADER